MNTVKLATAIREMARAIHDDGCNEPSAVKVTTADTSELLRVLANLVQGKDIWRSFGAPGDWGYGTPIGDALAAAWEPTSENRKHFAHDDTTAAALETALRARISELEDELKHFPRDTANANFDSMDCDPDIHGQ